MNYIDALTTLCDGVSFSDCKDIAVSQAQDMLEHVASLLGYPCPSHLPTICIDDELPANVLGRFIVSIKIVTLRRYDGGLQDQGVLVHELAHYVQQYNDVPFCEVEAERARHAWIAKHAEAAVA